MKTHYFVKILRYAFHQNDRRLITTGTEAIKFYTFSLNLFVSVKFKVYIQFILKMKSMNKFTLLTVDVWKQQLINKMFLDTYSRNCIAFVVHIERTLNEDRAYLNISCWQLYYERNLQDANNFGHAHQSIFLGLAITTFLNPAPLLLRDIKYVRTSS